MRDAYLQDVRRESVIQGVLAFMQSAQTTFKQLNSVVKSALTLPGSTARVNTFDLLVVVRSAQTVGRT